MHIWVFFILLMFIIYALSFTQPDRVRRNRFVLIGTGILLFLLMGLRYPGGVDATRYCAIHEYFTESGSTVSVVQEHVPLETGYLYYSKALATIFNSPQALMLSQALIVVLCSYYFISRYANDAFLAVLLFVTIGDFAFHLIGFRQSIAMGVCLLAVPAAERKKWLQYGLLLLLAFTFHRSALVFIPFYFLIHLKNQKMWYCLVLIGSVMLFLCIDLVLSIGNEIRNSNYSVTQEFHWKLRAAVLFFLLVAFGLSKTNTVKEHSNVLPVMLLLAASSWIVSCYAYSFVRIGFYFSIGASTALANAISLRRDRMERLIIAIVVAGLAIMLFLYMMSGRMPYFFFWQNPDFSSQFNPEVRSY